MSRDERGSSSSRTQLQHYVPRMGGWIKGRDEPILTHTLTETSVLFPDVPHSWLDGGRLLRLHDPHHKVCTLYFLSSRMSPRDLC